MAETPKHRVRIDAQGRALIPKPLRDALGLEAPSEAIAWVDDGRLVLEPREQVLARMRARYRRAGESLAERLGEERRDGSERDDGRG